MMSDEGPDLQVKFAKQIQCPVQMHWLKNKRGLSILFKASDWNSPVGTWKFSLFASNSDL